MYSSVRDQKDDLVIYKLFSKYVYLTVEQLVTMLNRGPDYVQKRMLAFHRNKYLNRVQDGRFGPCMYFLAEKGGHKAYSFGFSEEVRFIQRKSEKSIKHDRTLSKPGRLVARHVYRGRRWF